MLPDARATRRGDVARVLHGDGEVRLHDEGGYVAVWIGERVALTPERTPQTASVVARSLAAHFDARWARG